MCWQAHTLPQSVFNVICFSEPNHKFTTPYCKAGLFQTVWQLYWPSGIWSSGPPTAEYLLPSSLFWLRQSPSLAEVSVLLPLLHRAVPLGPVNTNACLIFGQQPTIPTQNPVTYRLTVPNFTSTYLRWHVTRVKSLPVCAIAFSSSHSAETGSSPLPPPRGTPGHVGSPPALVF